MNQAANPAHFFGEATFEYDGRALTITIDNMALIEAEGILGESMLDFLPQVVEGLQGGRNPQVRHISGIIAGGLKQNHPEITQKYVMGMVMSQNANVKAGLLEALAAIDLPQDDVGNVASPVTPNRRARKAAKKGGAGTTSSGSGAK